MDAKTTLLFASISAALLIPVEATAQFCPGGGCQPLKATDHVQIWSFVILIGAAPASAIATAALAFEPDNNLAIGSIVAGLISTGAGTAYLVAAKRGGKYDVEDRNERNLAIAGVATGSLALAAAGVTLLLNQDPDPEPKLIENLAVTPAVLPSPSGKRAYGVGVSFGF